ncbi:MAG: Phosphoesterase [Candidatus Magasanikbacteria bacterium GW2011_GWA2_45_39]|uniref:Phosphoesterase n=1 Tax=Candidatus Magasanikbacteria bacterium GW2011_GWA2_45_39 TaxID=1619041 RepID=A0A0G1MH83_9BACT|nr:MAG: Phosphoesterase [Candidatus Magasanikbacteria bacterium GW2011_GWA2_45_39]
MWSTRDNFSSPYQNACMIKVLMFGDVVARLGREAVKDVLPELKKQYEPHFVIINAENIAHGTGSTPKTLAEMEMAGVQCFTSGDHWFDKPTVAEYLAQPDNLLVRPANLADEHAPGVGAKVFSVGTKKILVVNLLGQVFIEKPTTSPFKAVDEILARYKGSKLDATIVDFHTEATSEQYAMGWHLDGRASLLVGTHTHVPTADARILPKGLGYITDIGMTGAHDEVIGVKKEAALARFLNPNPDPEKRPRFEWPEEGNSQVNAVYAELDEKTHTCKKIQLIQKFIKHF